MQNLPQLTPSACVVQTILRKLGNIGAHMEKDINLIVDVDPQEAELLIGLIETLLKEWYVVREERRARMGALVAAASSKKA